MSTTPDLPLFETASGHALPGMEIAGKVRLMGLLPTPVGLKSVVPTWLGAGKPDIPASDYRLLDRRVLQSVLPAVDQGNHGSCTNGATRGAMEFARYSAGSPYIPLSGTWAYAHCNGGVDMGASIGGVMQYTYTDGLCTDEAFPETVIHERHARDLARCKAEQARFRWGEIYQGESAADIASALLCGYEVVSAVCVGWSFSVDPTTLQVKVGWGFANHAIHACGLIKPAGEWLVLFRNSWGEDWPSQGKGGWFAMSFGQIDNTRAQEIWIGRYPIHDPQDAGGPVLT